MNIAIIGSGGDGAGMNMCLYQLCKSLKNHNIKLFYRGYQGLIDNSVAQFSINQLKEVKNKGGIIIKSSRSPEFMTKQGFEKAINTLKKHSIDVLIVMGGNGSLKGSKEIVKAGINVVFVPTTIDNDIEESDYCMGFDTAVENAVDFVNKVDTSMQAFDRTCIYEVMGRHCEDIANAVTQKTNSDFCYTTKSKKTDMLKKIKEVLKTGVSPKIILQENVINADELKAYIQKNISDIDVKVAIVGYVQRGGNATAKELGMAKGFAGQVVKAINNNQKNVMICYKNNQGFMANKI